MITDKLTKARIQVMLDPTLAPIAAVLLGMPWERLPDGQTMATDGKKLYYSKDFIESISMLELVAVLIHEAFHVLFHHQFRLRGRDHGVFNMAADYAVNLMLYDMGQRLPEGCLLDMKFRGLAAEQIYEELMRNPPPQPPKPQPGGVAEPKSEKDPGQEKEMDAEEFNQAQAEALENVAKIKMGAEKAGKLGAGLKKRIESAMVQPVDWITTLSQFVDTAARADYSYAKINRSGLRRGMILPSLSSESIGQILVVIDTSGSTLNRKCLNRFLAQLFHIVGSYPDSELKLVCCDTDPVLIGEYESGDLPEPEEIELEGGGGTSLEKLKEFLEKNDIDPTVGIYFTDCELSNWGDPLPFPLLVASDRYPPAYYPLPEWVEEFVKL